MIPIQGLNTSYADLWYLRSVDTIQYLQTNLKPYESWIVGSSVYGDNREAFTFFFPLFTGLFSVVGSKVLWAAIFSEWFNLMLKWLFKGDRPYWWIYETQYYNDNTRPILQQFPNTCETGPGTPSGHLTLNVAVFYVVTKCISNLYIWNSRRNVCLKFLASTFVHLLYIMWIALIFVSRLYIQTHFIHQCVWGVLCGLLVGRYVWNSKAFMKLQHFQCYLCAIFLFATSSMMYYALQHYGLNPLWSVPLAIKHCMSQTYIRLDTQPTHGIVRYTAAALGLGYGLTSKYRKNNEGYKGIARTFLTIVSGISIGKSVFYILELTPKEDLTIYYSLCFGLYFIFPYIVVAILPNIIGLFYSKK